MNEKSPGVLYKYMKNTKICYKCKKKLHYSQFYKNKSHPDGLRSECKECDKSRTAAASRRRQKTFKNKVVFYYTKGLNKCTKCEFDDIRALTVDHIDGGGNKHIKEAKISGNLYKWLIKNKYPPNFQILCMNCQFIKRHENKEWKKPNKNAL